MLKWFTRHFYFWNSYCFLLCYGHQAAEVKEK
jgi:hypothetical protein